MTEFDDTLMKHAAINVLAELMSSALIFSRLLPLGHGAG